MRQRHRQFNLDRSLDSPAQRLEEILDLERDTLDRRGDAASRAKRSLLDSLPARLSEAIERLRDYDFEDQDARSEFENLLEEIDEHPRPGGLPQPLRRSVPGAEGARLRRVARAHAGDAAPDRIGGGLPGRQLRADRPRSSSRSARRAGRGRAFSNCGSSSSCSPTRATRGAGRGACKLSPKGVRAIGQLALRDIYQGFCATAPAGIRPDHRGVSEVRPEATKPYRYGEPLHVDLVRTLKKAVARRPGTPLRMEPEDFEVYDTLHATTTSTVLLLDMSWSMSWEGRFAAAKKVALAMESLIRSRYPRDYFGIVGFYTRATELKVRDLPEATWNMGDPFTNLQDGLRLASQMLSRQPSSQPVHDRDHRRPADRLLLARAPVLRVAAVLRRDQHARRAGNAARGRARHPPRRHHQHVHARRQPAACAPSSSA